MQRKLTSLRSLAGAVADAGRAEDEASFAFAFPRSSPFALSTISAALANKSLRENRMIDYERRGYLEKCWKIAANAMQ